jgi:tetratricopeptide (TPR) repeat protein
MRHLALFDTQRCRALLLITPLSVLLFAGMEAGAQVDNSNQNGQAPSSPPGENATPAQDGEAGTRPAIKPGVTVTGKPPRAEQPLPTLRPDEFNDCITRGGSFALDPVQVSLCNLKIRFEKKMVFEACANRSGNTAPSRAIQACTELTDRNTFDRHVRFFAFANRAAAYCGQGDKQHALDDYNAAVKLASHNADLYYSRGVCYATQSDGDAALRDFNTAIGINPKLVPALLQRAKIYRARGNFSLARADYSEAIGLQPKTAALWSERGYACLRQHDYESAIRDEAQAIQLDPKLARAYFLRGAAFGGLGDSHNALSDIETAVRLDPSLDRYVTFKGEDTSLTLPP